MPDKPALKAVIFDFDGVLADTRQLNVRFLQALYRDAGYAVPSSEAIIKCYPLTMQQTIRKLSLNNNDPSAVWLLAQKYPHSKKYFDPRLCKFPSNLEAVLANLRKFYSLGIASGRTRVSIHHLLNYIGAKHFFDSVVGFEDYTNPKPHPEPLWSALAKLSVSPTEAVYVGDHHIDVKAAHSAGMPVIQISNKPSSDATLSLPNFRGIEQSIKRIANLVS